MIYNVVLIELKGTEVSIYLMNNYNLIAIYDGEWGNIVEINNYNEIHTYLVSQNNNQEFK